MVVIKVQANKELRLLNNHLVKREGKEGSEKEKEYQDDARLMDIYSLPGYQVEIEVPTNSDGSSKQFILDEAIRGEVDPEVLEEAGVSVYEIPTEKIKLPVDDWVDVEDLGMDDNTHPKDVDPVEMATPAPSQKVWLASNVQRMSPMPYSKAVITTDRPDIEVDTTTNRPDVSTAMPPMDQETGQVLPVPRGQTHIGGEDGNHPLHDSVGDVLLRPPVHDVQPDNGPRRPRQAGDSIRLREANRSEGL
jgi:hypothetical protein